jgi:molybdopterin-binding protein
VGRIQWSSIGGGYLVDELGLKAGSKVTAVIKSSDVMIAVE